MRDDPMGPECCPHGRDYEDYCAACEREGSEEPYQCPECGRSEAETVFGDDTRLCDECWWERVAEEARP